MTNTVHSVGTLSIANRGTAIVPSPLVIEQPAVGLPPETIPVVLADKVQRRRLTESDRGRTIRAVVLI